MHLRVQKEVDDILWRKPEWDLFVTVLRHKYIPPLMEYFTDLAVISIKREGYWQEDSLNMVKIAEDKSGDMLRAMATRRFLREKHEIIVDSVHMKQESMPVIDRYNKILQLKAQYLLMDEQTMKFFSQVLKIHPQEQYERAI